MVHTDLEVVKGDGAGCEEKVSGSFGGRHATEYMRSGNEKGEHPAPLPA